MAQYGIISLYCVLGVLLMFLKKSTNSKTGRTYLSIVRTYRDKAKGVTKTSTIKSLGYLDELEKQFDDPIVYFSKMADEMNHQEALSNSSAVININKLERLSSSSTNAKNLGYAALSLVYHELGLHTFFTSHSRSWGTGFNANSVMKLLVFSRILAPASKKKTFSEKDLYFDKMDFSLDDVYRFLTKVAPLSQKLQAYLNQKVSSRYDRNTDFVYYDVTNYFFEIDKQDNIRKKGVSKEKRSDPIVQMGLFVDSLGIPISYALFPGNTNDCETLIPVMKKMKQDFDFRRVIVVADKGMNTHKNIVFNLLNHDGYVYSQTVRGAHKELKTFVLDEKGYRNVGNYFRIKSRVHPREISVRDISGKIKKLRIDEKQVVYYSDRYARKAKAEREAVLLKAHDLVNNPGKYNRATSYGAAKYVKNLVYDKETAEIVTTKQKPVFDIEKLKQAEMFDGYYAIITSELDKSDEEIVEIYRGLWRIEDSFKVTKSDLSSRPVFVSREDHINAHFLICFVALLIARLLALRLGNLYSISRIVGSLNKTTCVPLEENWYALHYTDEITEAIRLNLGIDFGLKYLGLGDIKKIIGHTKKS